MTTILRASDVVGLPVVTLDSGEDVAEIRDVVYDAGRHQLLGFTLNKRGFLAGRLKTMLSASALHAVGKDAVTIPTQSAIAHSEADGTAASETVNVIGNKVLTAEGTMLGTVDGVILRSGTKPEAVGYEIKPEEDGPNVFVPISAQMALSNDNLLLPSESSALLRNDLNAFAGVVGTHLEGNAQ